LHFDIAIAGENFTHFPAVITLNQVAQRRKKPFALWSGSIDTAYASGNLLSNLYRRWLYGRTKAFLTYGAAASQFLQRRGVPADRIVTSRQVVPAEQIALPAQSREELGLANKQVVLYVGYLNSRKGVPTLLQAFQQVAQENDRLVLVGDGPEKAALQQMAAGDERIQFPGYLEGAKKSSWYAASDLFVLPTRHDPWGLVVNEAMSFGLPIITTEAAGCAELIQENGFIVPVDDVNAMAAALNELLKDPTKRRQLGQLSLEYIAPYTVDAACEAFLQLIQQALK
ncbi:MAG: glycosyltransferase family 4 protein, partial [Candidatus Promineifilaceae bacterium]